MWDRTGWEKMGWEKLGEDEIGEDGMGQSGSYKICLEGVQSMEKKGVQASSIFTYTKNNVAKST